MKRLVITWGLVLASFIVPVLLVGVPPAYAQAADVPALIKLVEQQPADMDRSTWREKRRDAAIKLARSKDKRAVPPLMKVAETETFDIIGEIAIEGLGNLGDASAVPLLQRIANDTARDKVHRDLAKKALGKLGASTTAKPPVGAGTPPGTGTPVTPPGPDPTANPTTVPDDAPRTDTTTAAPADPGLVTPPAPIGTGLLGDKAAADLPALPTLPDDTIAAYERLTFAGGAAHFGYDTVRKRSAFDADVSGRYARRLERERQAFGLEVDAHLVAGYVNPEGREQTRGGQLVLVGTGEMRFYSGPVYGVGKVALGTQLEYIADVEPDAADDNRETRKTADFQLALGGGYGRLIDVGGAIRARRLSRTLDAARALGKPIDAAVARRLQLTWWALRGERSSYRALVATVAILRESGILLGEPDAGLTYEILSVLRDSQLFMRPSGLDVQLVFGEGYLIRPEDPTPLQEGRVEQIIASAGYGIQLDDDLLEISGRGYGRLRLFPPDDQPAPWAAGAQAQLRRFTYGDHGDPFGALDLTAHVMASDDDLMDSDLGLRFSAAIGFTHWLNQASGVRLAGNLTMDAGELFVGASLEATYGFLDTTFAVP